MLISIVIISIVIFSIGFLFYIDWFGQASAKARILSIFAGIGIIFFSCIGLIGFVYWYDTTIPTAPVPSDAKSIYRSPPAGNRYYNNGLRAVYIQSYTTALSVEELVAFYQQQGFICDQNIVEDRSYIGYDYYLNPPFTRCIGKGAPIDSYAEIEIIPASSIRIDEDNNLWDYHELLTVPPEQNTETFFLLQLTWGHLIDW